MCARSRDPSGGALFLTETNVSVALRPQSMSQLDYRPLCESWPVSGKVTVSFEPFLELEIKIPVDFLVKSGDDSLAFLQYLVQQVVVERGYLSRSGEADSSLDLNARPEIGASYHFRPREHGPVSSAPGLSRS